MRFTRGLLMRCAAAIAAASSTSPSALLGGACYGAVAPDAVLSAPLTQIAVTPERRRIRYYGPITTASLLSLNTVLCGMADEGDDTIHLHIQSPGGDLLPALYTADLIERSRAPVHTHVDGYAASAASLLTVCGSHRTMSARSVMLIHELRGGHEGKYTDLRQHIDNDRTLMECLLEIYASHSSVHAGHLAELLSRDVYMRAHDCLALGLVDEVIA